MPYVHTYLVAVEKPLCRLLNGPQNRCGRSDKQEKFFLRRESKDNVLVFQPLASSLSRLLHMLQDRSVRRETFDRPPLMINPSASSRVNVKVLLVCFTLNVKLRFFHSLNVLLINACECSVLPSRRGGGE